ncbi:MAG: hypothetical protein AAB396_02265 [Patescibacteria group bacterium]
MKSKILFTILSIAVFSLLIGSSVLAVTIPGITQTGPTTVSGVVDILRNIVKWVYIVFFIIAVMFILFAAYTYLMASGDPEGVTKARNEIIYAAVAIIVALLAVGFDTAIATFLQTGQ